MRLIIVKDDGFVSVDGLGFSNLNLTSLPANFYALQWYGSAGELECIDPETFIRSNVTVDDISPYQSVIDLWTATKAQYDAETAAAQAAAEALQNAPPEVITRRQCALHLLDLGMISGPEAIAMTQMGVPPATIQSYLDTLPEPQRTRAIIDFAATDYLRNNPLLSALMTANNMTNTQVDDFFIAASEL